MHKAMIASHGSTASSLKSWILRPFASYGDCRVANMIFATLMWGPCGQRVQAKAKESKGKVPKEGERWFRRWRWAGHSEDFCVPYIGHFHFSSFDILTETWKIWKEEEEAQHEPNCFQILGVDVLLDSALQPNLGEADKYGFFFIIVCSQKVQSKLATPSFCKDSYWEGNCLRSISKGAKACKSHRSNQASITILHILYGRHFGPCASQCSSGGCWRSMLGPPWISPIHCDFLKLLLELAAVFVVIWMERNTATCIARPSKRKSQSKMVWNLRETSDGQHAHLKLRHLRLSRVMLIFFVR